MRDRLKRFLNFVFAIPFLGLAGTLYANHLEEYSECLARIGYDAQHMTLDVHFARNRALYRYHGVSFLAVVRLLNAQSLGRELNQRIIGKYHYEHLTYFPPKVAKIRRQKATGKALARLRRFA